MQFVADNTDWTIPDDVTDRSHVSNYDFVNLPDFCFRIGIVVKILDVLSAALFAKQFSEIMKRQTNASTRGCRKQSFTIVIAPS